MGTGRRSRGRGGARNRGSRARVREAQAAKTPGEPASPPPGPPPRGRKLKTLEHTRRALAAVVRGVEAGTLDLGRGRVLVYALSTLANVVETAREQGELLQRIIQLEQAVAGRNHGAAGWRQPSTTTTPAA